MKWRMVNRQQTMMAPSYVEDLISADHKARAIWQWVERLDLSRFLEPLRTSQIVDGGFTNRENIVGCAAPGIELVGSLPDPKERSAAAMKSLGIAVEFAPAEFRILDNGASWECPAGNRWEALRQKRKRGDLYRQDQAREKDCRVCGYQTPCCPRSPERGRTVSLRLEEQAEVAAFGKKMETEAYRAPYRKRGEVAEFPNAWIEDKLGLRKFRVRGMAKAGSELLWACVTDHIMQWVRLIGRKPAMA